MQDYEVELQFIIPTQIPNAITISNLVEPCEDWIEAQGWPIICGQTVTSGPSLTQAVNKISITYHFHKKEQATLFKMFWQEVE